MSSFTQIDCSLSFILSLECGIPRIVDGESDNWELTHWYTVGNIGPIGTIGTKGRENLDCTLPSVLILSRVETIVGPWSQVLRGKLKRPERWKGVLLFQGL